MLTFHIHDVFQYGFFCWFEMLRFCYKWKWAYREFLINLQHIITSIMGFFRCYMAYIDLVRKLQHKIHQKVVANNVTFSHTPGQREYNTRDSCFRENTAQREAADDPCKHRLTVPGKSNTIALRNCNQSKNDRKKQTYEKTNPVFWRFPHVGIWSG